MHKRSQGLETRKEDKPCEFWEIGSFKGTLDSTTKDLLREIHDFKGFAPFLPEDILIPEGDVRVILDDKKSRFVTVTLKELEEEFDSLKERVRSLKELLDNLRKSKSTNNGEIAKIHRKIEKLQKRINDLEGTISRLRKEGKDSETFENKLLGYYIRTEEGIPEIHLMMGTLMRKPNPLFLTGITFVHELMHAFFDNHIPYVAHPDCRIIEEPIAEYGMLCFMKMFVRYNPDYKDILDNDILDVAKKHVEEKQDSLGVCHYGFGAYLFEDRTDFGVDWVSLFHSSCPTLIMSSPEVQAYELTISPIKYPYDERACECKLYYVLRTKRFGPGIFDPLFSSTGATATPVPASTSGNNEFEIIDKTTSRVIGKAIGMPQTALFIIRDFCSRNSGISLADLQRIFARVPHHSSSRLSIVESDANVNTYIIRHPRDKRKRFFVDAPIALTTGEIVMVSTQWGNTGKRANFGVFKDVVDGLGYIIK